MPGKTTVAHDLASDIVNRVEELLLEAEETTKPLELDPFRGQLFELFVMAEAAAFVQADSDPDLSTDGLARQLAQRWNLSTATQSSVENQSKLPSEHLSKMRILWSCMRMWMEWTYAWKRWPEFHDLKINDS